MTPNDFQPRLHVSAHHARRMRERQTEQMPIAPAEMVMGGMALAILASLALWLLGAVIYVRFF